MVFAMPAGIVHIDPEKQKWAKEFMLVYSVEGPKERPRGGQGQYRIYDTRPGDPGYSPIWKYNFVVVPSDYEANTLRSEDEILKRG